MWSDGWIERWTEKWTDGPNNGRKDLLMDRHAIYVHRHAKNNHFSIDFAISTNALRTDGQIDRRTDRQILIQGLTHELYIYRSV